MYSDHLYPGLINLNVLDSTEGCVFFETDSGVEFRMQDVGSAIIQV